MPILQRLRRTCDALGFRLGLAVGVSVMFACLLVTTGVLLRTAEAQFDARTTEMQTYANVLASGVADAMVEGDAAGVTRTLNAIATAQGISFAAAYDEAGRRVAGIGMQAVLVGQPTERGAAGSLAALFDAQTITVEAPIRKGGARIGSLRIAGEQPSAGAAFLREMRNAAFWASLALAIGMIVGLVFQRQIVRPLERLTHTIARAGDDKRLPERVSLAGKGEIGVLARAYNRMIDEITTRETQLNDYRLHLEELVDQRTEELSLARDEAEAATEAKSRFLATMSHEIRTPMNGLLVMAELLERSNLPPSEARHAGTIARSGRSLMHLLNDIMDFSKLEAGRIELESIPLSADEIVGDCVGLFWEQARGKGIEIVPHIAPDVPVSLLGDPTRIGQCLSNLVGNAIKFTEEGHVGIDLSREAGGILRIAVSDTGAGIPEDRLDSIFEAFSQADQSTTRRHGGTGLGLNICVQLAEAMGGTIDVTSTLGSGSCFTLRLPLEVAEARALPAALPLCVAVETARPALRAALVRALTARGIETEGDAEAVLTDIDHAPEGAGDIPRIGLWRLDAPMPEEAVRGGLLDDLLRVPVQRADLDAVLGRIATRRLRGPDLLREHGADRAQDGIAALASLRVLVADDSAVNREVMVEALDVHGIVPILAHDGAEALERLTAGGIDIAFIDGEMPNLDGFETARQARAAGVATRLVLFSAHSRDTLARRAAENGFDDSLPKPFPLEALDALLSAAKGIEPGGTAAPDAQDAPAAIDGDAEQDEGEAPILDPASLASLRALDARRPGAMAKVLDRFDKALPGAHARLLDTLRDEDGEERRKAAHAMKSMCLSVGAAQLAETLAAVERSAAGEMPAPADWSDEGVLEAVIDGRMDALDAALDRLRADLAEPARQRTG